jgi:hypothetical protein
MPRFPLARPAPAAAIASLALALACGCERTPREALGYQLSMPAGWDRWPGEPPLAPGEVLEAYRVPAEPAPGSLIVLRSGFAPRTSAAQIAIERRRLLAGLPGMASGERLEVHESSEIAAGGARAARIEVTAPGTGSSLAPTSLGVLPPPASSPWIPTRRVWIVIPRGAELGTLEILLHVPEEAYAPLRSRWEAALASLKLAGAD